MRLHRALKLVAPLFALLIAALPGIGQVSNSAAALKGTVLDEQGGGVPNATVTVTNTALGLSKVAKTGSDGTYQILSLNPGTYRIEVEASGFQKEVADSVVISVGQLAVYDAHMKVGAVSMVVEVSGNVAPLIDTEQTQQANTINPLQVEDLPNINRNFTQEVYTLPGVANSDAPRSQTPGFTGFFTTGFSIGGSNGRNNLSTIDGGENEYGTGQYRVSTYPLDAIQEYQVNRSAYAAEFGFSDGAAINIVTKSGGNNFHGDAFGYFYDRYTDAQSYFYGVEHATDPAFSTQPFSQDVYAGGTLGGPIVKDKIFFLLSYEGQKVDAAEPNPILATCEVQGLSFASVGLTNADCPTQAAQAEYLAAVNAFFGPGNPLGASLQAAYTPLTNPGYAQIIANNNGTFDAGTRQNNAVGRLDFVPNSRDSISLRLGYARDNYITTGVDGVTLRTRDYSILTNWTHTFSPTVVNQLLLQVVPWNRANATQPDTGSTQEILVGTGFSTGALQFAGSSSYYPYLAHQNRGQAEDNVTWNWKSHTIKFGGSLRIADYRVTEPLWVSGQYDFAGGFPTIYAASPAVQGLDFFFNEQPACAAIFGVSCIQDGLPLGPPPVNTTASNMLVANEPFNWEQGFGNPSWQGWGKYFGAFIQDTWKITRNFTLTPGIRFDADGEPAPLRAHYYPEPRLGFSWDVMSDHKTVIRGGGGIYASPIDVLVPSYSSLLSGTGQYLNVLGSQEFPQLTGLGLPPSEGQLIWTAGVEGDAAAGIAANSIPLHQVNGAQITALCGSTGLCSSTAPKTPGQTNQVIYNVASNYNYPYSVEASLSIERELVHDLSLEVAYDMYHAVHQQMPVETGYGIAECGAVTAGGDPIFLTTPAAIAAGAEPVVGNCYAPSLGGVLSNPNVTEQTTYQSIGSSIYHGMTASLTKRISHNLQFQANYTWSKAIDNFIDFASFQEWYRPQQLGLYRAVSTFNVPQKFIFNAVYSTPRSAEGVLGAIYRNVTIAPIVTLQSGLPYTLLTQSMVNGPLGTAGTDIPGEDGNSAAPILEKRNSLSGVPFYSWDMTIRKGFYLMKDEKLRMDFSVQAINILNRENFNNIFANITCAAPSGPNSCAGGGAVTSATTTANLAGGQVVNLATGPFTGVHGVKPTTSAEFNQPGFFAPALSLGGLFGGANYVPRQVEFGLRLSF
jgi:Carboxypeptidase regulatory-like domain